MSPWSAIQVVHEFSPARQAAEPGEAHATRSVQAVPAHPEWQVEHTALGDAAEHTLVPCEQAGGVEHPWPSPDVVPEKGQEKSTMHEGPALLHT